jgi:hypothetical protein
MQQWLEETPMNRAKCVAHIIHRNNRQRYESEQKKPEPTGNPADVAKTKDALTRLLH